MHARQNLTFIRPFDRRTLKKIKEYRGGVGVLNTRTHECTSATMESQEPNQPNIPLSGYRYCPHYEQMVSNRTYRSHCMQKYSLDSTKNSADAIGTSSTSSYRICSNIGATLINFRRPLTPAQLLSVLI